mmetsp:Transcript_38394/g.108596  ORF Transcript_38394/g.108596 Transcript_38394/m.108596 type:complete len:330 (+) Transcript_38394:1166-2155(+)
MLEGPVLVPLHALEVAHLGLEPLVELAELRLEEREVLLLHHLRVRVVGCGSLHRVTSSLEGVLCREVPEHDDRGRPVARVPAQQDVGAERAVAVEADRVDADEACHDSIVEYHALLRLHESACAGELRAAPDELEGPGRGAREGHLDLRHPLRVVGAGLQHNPHHLLDLAEVHLVPGVLVVLLRAPCLRRVHAAPVVAGPDGVVVEGGRGAPRGVGHVRRRPAGALLRVQPERQRARQRHRLGERALGHAEAEEALLLRGHPGDRVDLHAEQLPIFLRITLYLVALPAVAHLEHHGLRRQGPDVALHVLHPRQRRWEGRHHHLGACIAI